MQSDDSLIQDAGFGREDFGIQIQNLNSASFSKIAREWVIGLLGERISNLEFKMTTNDSKCGLKGDFKRAGPTGVDCLGPVDKSHRGLFGPAGFR